MVERRFAEDLETSAEEADQINRINEEEGVRWLYSFLSADKRKTYCLYEAPFADAIRRAAERAGLPADAVVEGALVCCGAVIGRAAVVRDSIIGPGASVGDGATVEALSMLGDGAHVPTGASISGAAVAVAEVTG